MNISKLALLSAFATASVLGAALPMTAYAASDIKNSNDCAFEGGTMTNIKGSDYCLVQIRPKEYEGAEYDGNQLGVVDCPGSKLNDGLFCMYPVTLNKTIAVVPAMPVAEPTTETSKDSKLVQELKEIAEKEAKRAAKKEGKKKLKKLFD